MLEAYWNLTGQPFSKAIKPQHLFIGQSLKELFSRLDYVKQQRGIMLLTGQPGVGKTTALRSFVDSLSELAYQSFYVPLATVNVLDFYRQLNQKLGGESLFFKSKLFVSIQQRIKDLVTHTKTIPLIIFDEAHLLKNENFTELQIITNFNMDSTDPAVIILAGQPFLADRLMRPVFKAFYQRIILKYHLSPLAQQEIGPFIEHHLALKGLKQSPFSESALEAIFKITAGVPRVVAQLALNTLIVGMQQKIQRLTEEQVYQAKQEL
jgi:general secretion pathway protein A